MSTDSLPQELNCESSERPAKNNSRRDFLRVGAVATAAAAVYPALASARVVDSKLAPSVAESSKKDDFKKGFELDEITIDGVQTAFQSGQYSSRSLTERYLARIQEIDKAGPILNSVIEINPDALQIAEALDRERKAKGARGPLHGIPILIKDNIDTGDRMSTTAGSLALVGSRPQRDAFVAAQLRRAGALILGKTNLSEWANIRSSHSTSGWSGRVGLTRNPYALDRNPCGSSSGTGAGVSANLCVVGVGTETDGSIVCPSSANGLVGIKPTVGLVSRSGIIPISHTQDSAGPMCRTLRDAAILLGAITGVDPEDPATAAGAVVTGREQRSFTDYTYFLQPNRPGARIGVVRKYFGFNDDVDALMELALDVLKKNGAIIVDPADIATIGRTGMNENNVLLYELKADLNAYLARLGPNAPVKTLKDVIEFNDQNKIKEMPYFGQDMFLKAQAKGDLTSKEYLDALSDNLRLARQEGIDATMDKFKLDALVAPTGGPAWITDLINGDNASGQTSTAAAVA